MLSKEELKPINSAEFKPVLADTVIELFDNRPTWLTVDKIAQDTGISTAWLWKLKARRSRNPNVANLETLYFYFTGKKISL